MKSPARDIAELLVSFGFGQIGKDILIRRTPDQPDNVLVVSSTVSAEPQTVTNSEGGFTVIDRPNIQIWCRRQVGKDDDGYSLMDQIKDKLHGKAAFDRNGARYIGIFAIGDIAELGADEKMRPVFSINFRTERSKK